MRGVTDHKAELVTISAKLGAGRDPGASNFPSVSFVTSNLKAVYHIPPLADELYLQ